MIFATRYAVTEEEGVTDDELRQAWTALQAQRRASNAPDAFADPSPDAVAAALDGTLSDAERERVLDALLSQGRGDELRVLHAMRRAAEESVSPARDSSTGGGRRWWPAAAAAAMVIAIGVPVWQSQQQDTHPIARDSATYRGGTADAVPLVAPASGVPWPAAAADSLRLTWLTVRDATAYTVELLDANGRVLLSQSTARDTTWLLAAPAAAVNSVPAGWWVYATLSDGRRLRSELRLFEAQRP